MFAIAWHTVLRALTSLAPAVLLLLSLSRQALQLLIPANESGLAVVASYNISTSTGVAMTASWAAPMDLLPVGNTSRFGVGTASGACDAHTAQSPPVDSPDNYVEFTMEVSTLTRYAFQLTATAPDSLSNSW
jgi:hypothetical protein